MALGIEIETRLKPGKQVNQIPDLTPTEWNLWRIWKRDRERFRQAAVQGGFRGELGQRPKPMVKDGIIWIPPTYPIFPETYYFDPFLGPMGPFENPEPPKGLEPILIEGLNVREYGGAEGQAESQEEAEGEGDAGEGQAASDEKETE